MRMLMAAGVDGIMSDYPDRLVAAQNKQMNGEEEKVEAQSLFPGTSDRKKS